MSQLKIITIGKSHQPWVASGIERYQVRLRPPYRPEWLLLPHSARQGDQARKEESSAILARIQPQDYVLLLDETGRNLSSPALAQQLSTALARGRGAVVLVIGGAYGVDARVQQRASAVWSLSKLVFPHQLVRLIVAEQLYRAQEITRGGPYHHG